MQRRPGILPPLHIPIAEEKAMTIQENKQLVSDFLSKIGEAKVPEAMDLLGDGFIWTAMSGQPPMGSMLGDRDKEAVRQMFEGVTQSMPGFHFVVSSMTAEDSRVSVEAMSEAKMADGKPYCNCYHILFEVDGGKIARAREYSDSLYASIVLAGSEV